MAIATIVLLVVSIMAMSIGVLVCGGGKKKKKTSSGRRSGPPARKTVQPYGRPSVTGPSSATGPSAREPSSATGPSARGPSSAGGPSSAAGSSSATGPSARGPSSATGPSARGPSSATGPSARRPSSARGKPFNPHESVPENLKHHLPKQMYRPVGGRGALCLDKAIPLVHSLIETTQESDHETAASDASADMVGPVTGKATENTVPPLGSKSATAQHGETQDMQTQDLQLKMGHIKENQGPKSGGKQ